MPGLCLLIAASPAGGQDAPALQPDGPPLVLELTGNLRLGDVVTRVLLQNPELQSFFHEVRAREAAAIQAGLLPNPHLSFQAEDAAGTGQLGGFDRSELTLQLSQILELGGKRRAREHSALLLRDLGQWDYERTQWAVLTRAAQSFADVLAAQEEVALNLEMVHLAEITLNVVSERVRSGKVSPLEETRARINLSNTRMEKDRAQRNLEIARIGLVATWGSDAPEFGKAVGDFYRAPEPVAYDELKKNLDRNPEIARWSAERTHRQSLLALEESRAVPDLQVHGGYRRIEETNDNALVFGFSVPLQLFDRNQGAIEEARSRLNRMEAEKKSVETRIHTDFDRAYQELHLAFRQVTLLESEILPGAQTSFEAISEGYRYGKFGLLDVLDSQRTFFEGKKRYLHALADYHKSLAEVERLSGSLILGEEARP